MLTFHVNISSYFGDCRFSTKLTGRVIMSGRVKRTPLFGADGLLGIQGLGNNNKNNNDIMQVSAGIHRFRVFR